MQTGGRDDDDDDKLAQVTLLIERDDNADELNGFRFKLNLIREGQTRRFALSAGGGVRVSVWPHTDAEWDFVESR